jgi:hypothetical protein
MRTHGYGMSRASVSENLRIATFIPFNDEYMAIDLVCKMEETWVNVSLFTVDNYDTALVDMSLKNYLNRDGKDTLNRVSNMNTNVFTVYCIK